MEDRALQATNHAKDGELSHVKLCCTRELTTKKVNHTLGCLLKEFLEILKDVLEMMVKQILFSLFKH